jgi:3-hydroxyacyl-CoA dehydrogenase
MTAEYKIHDGVAVITLNNPPVNSLGHATRLGIFEGMMRALDDPKVNAIVLTGGGKGFSAGADIREFNTPKATQAPTLSSIIRLVENSHKPVIAAIHSIAMGGGLELALGCHYRVAAPRAQIALPEVKLGLLPGAGGTQRLPRVVGLELALNMIVFGGTVRSEDLAVAGLFDRLIDGDLIQGGLAFANEVVAKRSPNPRARDLRVTHRNPDRFIESARNTILATVRDLPAPQKCIDAIHAAVNQSFDDGLRTERDAFIHLVNTPESRAMRHAFFSERAASKIPDVPEDTPTREVRCVAVIGAGTMGAGIAMNFLNAGIPVRLLEAGRESLDRGVATINKNYENSVKKGKLKAEEAEARMGFLSTTLSYSDIGHTDLVIEAVFEDMNVKQAVFALLDEVMKPGAILASNTSTLDLNKIAARTRRPQDVVGMHFFSPANVMKLLEVVRGEKTAKVVLATVTKLARKIGKTAVISGVCDGFIGNRMIIKYTEQANLLLLEGALPDQVDKAIEKFGFAMGPFRMVDLAGNDIGWAIRKRHYAEKGDRGYFTAADLLAEMGRFGQKTSAGWYDYKGGDRKPYASQLVNEIIMQQAKHMGVERRQVSDGEIIGRLVYSLINEGARILDEGIATKASDIDAVYLTGYGFPRHRGGPMFYGDMVGLKNVVHAIDRFAKGPYGEVWSISPFLSKLAAEGKNFNG